eukprot:2623446-Amphidinium_carterae.1
MHAWLSTVHLIQEYDVHDANCIVASSNIQLRQKSLQLQLQKRGGAQSWYQACEEVALTSTHPGARLEVPVMPSIPQWTHLPRHLT